MQSGSLPLYNSSSSVSQLSSDVKFVMVSSFALTSAVLNSDKKHQLHVAVRCVTLRSTCVGVGYTDSHLRL